MLSSSIVYINLVLQKCFRFASKRFSCCACVGTSTPCWLRPPFTHGAVHTLPQLIQEAVRPDAEIYKKEIQFLCLRWESALCWILEAVRPDAESRPARLRRCLLDGVTKCAEEASLEGSVHAPINKHPQPPSDRLGKCRLLHMAQRDEYWTDGKG
ncbi:unnamed protein product [Arctia plantaginis]|uniref:Uncharacterized protein n=1 Tax=Arctia plantaginis TaxID=874455 RepID=A0A8S1ART6_ARCPL|nr:unnamed protein product [Arctia plantaginis]